MEPEQQETAKTLLDNYYNRHPRRRKVLGVLPSLVLSAAAVAGAVYWLERIPSRSINVESNDEFTNTLRPEAVSLGKLAVAAGDGPLPKKDPMVKDGVVIQQFIGDGGEVFTIRAHMLEKGIKLEPSTTYDAYLQVDSCHENKKCSSPEEEQIEIRRSDIVQHSGITDKQKVVGGFWYSRFTKYPFNSTKPSLNFNSYYKNPAASPKSPEVSLALSHAKFTGEEAEVYIGKIIVAEKTQTSRLG